MSKLSKGAYEFRGELLNMGGKVSEILLICLEKDLSATNQTIQLLYDKYKGEFSLDCAKILAGACAWILADKPDNFPPKGTKF